jgi:hypothetical protein
MSKPIAEGANIRRLTPRFVANALKTTRSTIVEAA